MSSNVSHSETWKQISEQKRISSSFYKSGRPNSQLKSNQPTTILSLRMTCVQSLIAIRNRGLVLLVSATFATFDATGRVPIDPDYMLLDLVDNCVLSILEFCAPRIVAVTVLDLLPIGHELFPWLCAHIESLRLWQRRCWLFFRHLGLLHYLSEHCH